MSQRPRVAHVISTPAGIGGAERVLQALVCSARDSGGTAHVFNPFAREPGSAPLRKILPDGSYIGLPCRTLGAVPSTRRALFRATQAFNPDIVHAHLFHASAMLATLPRPSGAARILTHHHGDIFAIENDRVREHLDRIATKRYDHVVPVSHAAREFLISRYGISQDRVRVILNGWSGDPRPRAAPDDAPTVICTANFRAQKGHTVLLAAFQQVLARLPSARLLLVGTGPLEGTVKREVASRGLQHAVAMCGHVDDIWPYLAESHVFALASHYEPLGIAAIEAMAAGLPVVAADVGGLPELVEPGVTGELFPKGDAAALARILTKLLTDPARARRLGTNGAARAESLTTEAMVERYFALYHEVLDEQARPPSSSLRYRRD